MKQMAKIMVGGFICIAGFAYSLHSEQITALFSEEERKIIFQEAIEAEKRGMAEADRQYPNDMEHNIALKQQLTTKHRRDVLKKHGLTEDSKEWHLIAQEGIDKGWVRSQKKKRFQLF